MDNNINVYGLDAVINFTTTAEEFIHERVCIDRLLEEYELPNDLKMSLIEKCKNHIFSDGEHLRIDQYGADELIGLVIEKLNYKQRSTEYQLPSWMEKNETDWVTSLKRLYEEPVSCPFSLSPAQGELLRSIVLNKNPKVSVEIGCFIGISSLWLGSGIRDSSNQGKLYSIDNFLPKFPVKRFYNDCIVNPVERISTAIEEANLLETIELIAGSSESSFSIIKNLVRNTGIDILFIDGDHSIEGCKRDFEIYSTLMNKEGYIIFHDVFPDKCGHHGPRYVLDEIVGKSLNFVAIDLHTQPCDFGISIVKKVY